MAGSHRPLWLYVFFCSLAAVLSSGLPGAVAVEPGFAPETVNTQPVTTLDQTQPLAPSSKVPDLPDDYHGFFLASPLTNAEPGGQVVSQAEVTLDAPVLRGTYSDETDLSHIFSRDTYYGTSVMWGFSRVNAERAWSLTRGSGVTIAVIDTGLDMAHGDMAGNVYSNLTELSGLPGVDDDGNGYVDDIRGWDFVNSDNNPTDDNGHGTHVSGIAAAVADNGKGIAGVAPGSKVLPVKVMDAGGRGTIANVIKGIKYAADLGAQIINLSIGIAKRYLSTTLLKGFQDVVDYAFGKGSVVVTAAGNENTDTSFTAPAGLNNTLAIGAADSRNKVASFSNKNPDIVAPGVSIGSLYPGNRYAYMSGTSMASPFAAGAAALIYSYYKDTYAGWTGAKIYHDIYTRLTRSATDLGKPGYDPSFGYGLLNAYAALTYQPPSATPAVSSQTKNSSGTASNASGGRALRVFNAAPFPRSLSDVFFSGSLSDVLFYRSRLWSWCKTSVSSDLTEEEKKKKASRGIF